jgi:Haem-binding domain
MWWIFRLACLLAIVVSARWWWPRVRSLPGERRWSRLAVTLVALAVLGAVAAQLIPYGWFHTNPAVVREPVWYSPQTRDLAVRACFDCHSNQVRYPWYSNIAPVSWLVASDVSGARGTLNFSDYLGPGSGRRDPVAEIARVMQRGSMPPNSYIWLHPSAKLTPAEQAALEAGLQKSLATTP